MIYECKVIKRNPINMVIKCNDILVQMPTDNMDYDYVYVDDNNGVYKLVSKKDYENSLKKGMKSAKPTKNIVEDKNILDSVINKIVE